MRWKYDAMIERGSIHQVLQWLNDSEPKLDIVHMEHVPEGWLLVHRTPADPLEIGDLTEQSTQRFFMVSVPTMPGVGTAYWHDYIKTAIGGWAGGMDPEEPIFSIDRSRVHVTTMETAARKKG